MPKRTDLKRILIIGSGPIVIGQACEFDNYGVQACKALRQEGYEVVLINSNPATIMTDPELADRTYVEPLSLGFATEVMRDLAGNGIIVCSIENFDPMGVHTGDSITVAPAQTLSDREYQMMRDAALRCLNEIGVDTGGSNVQFAINPENGRMVVVEMNPRVSRSSALASKATGFPIAKIAAKLAVGYRLDEIKNDITRATPACFEPTIDYVVVKIPRWQFEKFPGAEPVLGTQMKSVGEVMAIGRTFKQALCNAIRTLETGKSESAVKYDPELIQARLITPNPDRLGYIRFALERGYTVEQVHEITSIDPWFLEQMKEVVDFEQQLASAAPTKE